MAFTKNLYIQKYIIFSKALCFRLLSFVFSKFKKQLFVSVKFANAYQNEIKIG